MELSELDALRESLKEAKAEKEKLIKELDNIKLSHSSELDNLKKGALVIERIPQYEVKTGLHIDKAAFFNKIDSILTSYSSHRYTESFADYLKARIESYIRDYTYQSVTDSFYGKSSQLPTIERIIGFHEVENEVRDFYTKKYKLIIAEYNKYVLDFDEYKKKCEQSFIQKESDIISDFKIEIEEIKAGYETTIQQLKEEFEQKINNLSSNNEKTLTQVKQSYEKEIEMLGKHYESELKKLRPENYELTELLKNLGYEIKPGSFFNKEPKLVKIK